MFTGIVEQVGTFESLLKSRLRVNWPGLSSDPEQLAIGASVANNGACLTVVEVQGDTVGYDVVEETLLRTNLGSLKPGDPVNIERAAKVSSRLDGHIVQGHVDQIGTILSAAPQLSIQCSSEMTRYIVKKGSIAVDGVSLTVVELFEDGFSVSVIPHTSKVTTLGYKGPGDTVNLEFDVLAKYVERLFSSTPLVRGE
ncbi:MAG: riboflavin synthase [Acidimicrobiaceae bacterium]|nr:riboflavin synthase [Acidimicrobiaceae bacterium]